MRRPSRPLRLLGLALAALALLYALLWVSGRSYTYFALSRAVPDFEARHGSLDPAAWQRPDLAPSANAGSWYRAALPLVDNTTPNFGAWKEGGPERRPLSHADLAAALEAAHAANATPLRLLREAATRSGCFIYRWLPAPDVELPRYLNWTDLARLDLELAARDFAAGDRASGAARLDEVLALANCLRSESVLIVRIIGDGLASATLRSLHAFLSRGDLDAALESVDHRLVQAEFAPKVADLVRAEAAVFRPDAVWRTARKPRGERTGWWDPLDLSNLMLAKNLEALGQIIPLLDRPEPPPPIAEGPRWPWRLDDWLVGQLGRNYWLFERQDRELASLRLLARAAIALRRQGLATGSYAAAALPPVLSTVAPLGGDPVRVALASDGSARLELPASERESQRLQTFRTTPRTFPWSWTLLAPRGRDGSSPGAAPERR